MDDDISYCKAMMALVGDPIVLYCMTSVLVLNCLLLRNGGILAFLGKPTSHQTWDNHEVKEAAFCLDRLYGGADLKSRSECPNVVKVSGTFTEHRQSPYLLMAELQKPIERPHC